MSTPEATLYYGFYLGNPGEGWAASVTQKSKDTLRIDQPEDLPWYQAALEDGDEDFRLHMRIHLLSEAEIDAADLDDKGITEAVTEAWGIELVEHGCFPYGETHIGIAMAGSVHTADDWTPKAIAPQSGGNHFKLLTALHALGLKPIQANPSWILAPGEY
jgi:hypothetical protein